METEEKGIVMEAEQQIDAGAEVGDVSPMKEAVTFEAETNAAVSALDQLAAALATGLFARRDKECDPLYDEWEKAKTEGRDLRDSHATLKRRVEAQTRILAGEIDRAIAEGRDADADAKKQEAAQLERSLADILVRAEACERRIHDLAAMCAEKSRAVFEQTYPPLREACVAVETAMAEMLDTVWSELKRYEQESSGVRLRRQHLEDLTPRERGPERDAFENLRGWFGGRQ